MLAELALYETGVQLQSQMMELYQANQLTDQTRREKSWLCNGLEIRNRAFQEDRTRICQQIEELRTICCTEAERARQLRIDELSTQEEENKIAYGPKWRTTEQSKFVERCKRILWSWNSKQLGVSHVPSQPISIPSPGGLISRDSFLQLAVRNSFGTTRHVFEDLPARGDPSAALENLKNVASTYCRLKANIIAEDCTTPTPRFGRNFATRNPLHRPEGTYSPNCVIEVPR